VKVIRSPTIPEQVFGLQEPSVGGVSAKQVFMQVGHALLHWPSTPHVSDDSPFSTYPSMHDKCSTSPADAEQDGSHWTAALDVSLHFPEYILLTNHI